MSLNSEDVRILFGTVYKHYMKFYFKRAVICRKVMIIRTQIAKLCSIVKLIFLRLMPDIIISVLKFHS